MPKGVLWRQEDIFHSALYSVGAKGLNDVVKRALREGPRVIASSPFMHGAAHWVAFNMWHLGGTVIIQSDVRRLDPDDIWSTAEREGATVLSIVGDAHGRPLADALRSGNYDLSHLRQLSSGGAILSAQVKEEFLDLLPRVRILDALGSSEAGTQASQYLRSGSSVRTGHFEMKTGNVVLKEDLSGVTEPGAGEVGWVARSGRVPLGYYKDPAKTSETFPTIDGVRFALAGDRAIVEADGTISLLGRDSATINTGGEKVFAEEVEQALKLHPDVYDAIVVGTPHPHWGQQVTALVEPREGARLSEAILKQAARAHLADYKIPKVFIFVEQIVRAPSGKPDHRWARNRAHQALGLES
jgi:acyl-CoA synthetase (AMP-forming)/AMP-acid ligase II